MFKAWLGSVTTSGVAVVGEAWGGVRVAAAELQEAASGLTDKLSTLDGVAATLQQALLLDEPASVPPILPPWDDVGPEADALPDSSRLALRSQLMRLAKARAQPSMPPPSPVQNKRNFTESPPEGEEFDFRMEDHLRVAEAAMSADPQLRTIRFHLVPQYVSEVDFWRNYFWRIKLIRQAHGLPAQFPLRPPTPSPPSLPSGEAKTPASTTTSEQAAAGQAQHTNDDESDDEAAFLAELEALEKENTTGLGIGSTPVASVATTAGDINNASTSISTKVAEGVPLVAGVGAVLGGGAEECAVDVDDDDEEWEKELELELRAELGGLDAP